MENFLQFSAATDTDINAAVLASHLPPLSHRRQRKRRLNMVGFFPSEILEGRII